MASPSSCLFGSVDFIRVTVRQKSGELYMTEFVSCIACGVMYHRPEPSKSIEPMTAERRELLRNSGWI